MHIDYHALWPTQVWVVNLQYSEEKLSKLANLLIELDGVKTDTFDAHANLLDGDYGLIKELKSDWVTATNDCLAAAGETNRVKFVQRSWANYMQPYNWSPPHIHGSNMSSAFTVCAKPGSGKFIVSNSHPSELLSHDLGKRSYMWERECIPGELILFSGHVQHQVTTNLSGELRISVAANIRLDPPTTQNRMTITGVQTSPNNL